jgi:hypothetical protein
MSTCARCNRELGRKKWWIDGKEYHEQCVRSAEDWKELDRLAAIAMQGLSACPTSGQAQTIATFAYHIAEAMLDERRRRRSE